MAPDSAGSSVRERAATIVRSASARDAAALARTASALSSETRGSNPAHAMDESAYRSFMAAEGKGFCLVAEEDEQIVAGLLVQFDASRPGEAQWWLHNAYVAPHRRGRGVFARMYADIASRARQAGVRCVRVSVMSENNDARSAYARLGFEDITERIAGERVNSMTDPAVYTQLGMTQPPFRVLQAMLPD